MRISIVLTFMMGLILSLLTQNIYAKNHSGIWVAANSDNHAHHAHGSQQMSNNSSMSSSNTAATGVGVLNSINPDTHSINITHQPIPSIGWPEMTMDIPVSKRIDLSAFRPNSKVQFTLKLGRDKVYRITKMEPVNNSNG